MRACLECARVRGRCDKADPCCSRCVGRSLACVYPHEAGRDGCGKRPRSDAVDEVEVEQQTQPMTAANVLHHPPRSPDCFSDFLLLANIAEDASLNSINWLAPDDGVDIDYMSLLDPRSPPAVDAAAATQPTKPSWDVAQTFPQQSEHTGCPLGSPPVVSPPPPVSSTASRLSAESNSPRLVAHGGIYATSTVGSRIPCTARTRRSPPSIWGSTPLPPVTADMAEEGGDDDDDDDEDEDDDEDDQRKHAFANLSSLTCPAFETAEAVVSSDTYHLMLSHYRRLYLHTDGGRGSSSNCFPDHTHMNLFATLFFEHFDPILPIYNSRAAALEQHWVLALAIVAVGSQYSGTVEMARCVVPLHQFLRRALVAEAEGGETGGDDSSTSTNLLARAQALALSQVGMMYYGSQRLDRLAQGRRAQLADIVTTTMPLLAREDDRWETERDDNEPVQDAWRRWMTQESWRRLAYTIWVTTSLLQKAGRQQQANPENK